MIVPGSPQNYSLKPPHRPDSNPDDWLVTFADMATLLLCFFIIMFALTYMPPEDLKKVSEALKKEGFSTSDAREDPFEDLVTELQVSLGASGYDQYLYVETKPGQVDIELASSSFFASGSAQLKREAVPVLERVLAQIKPFVEQTEMTIKVEGHTDDVPMKSAQFPSNWELSGARASNVVRFFIAKGIDPTRLEAIAYAETRPKVENRDATGKAITVNQEINRRVVISISR